MKAWLTVPCVLLMLALPGPAVAGPGSAVAGEPGYVKYYRVTGGDQENLIELANRLLDDPDRADDIYQLNAGRTQPDGKALASQQQSLNPGWLLILPWDAYGDGVQYGQLSSGPAKRKCAGGASVSGADSTWATARLAVDQAWERGQGSGVLVAVVDSGIDASLPELAGRVAAGADVTTTGGGRGDADCLGSGTGMASVIAANGDSMTGVAPQSTVFPVRIVANTPSAEPAKVAAGIEVAISAGATVIALGSYVDIRDAAIAAAIETAIAHDVLLVAEASNGKVEASAGGANADPGREGLLRVAGVGPEGQQAAEYTTGAVDLTAPGIDVPTLGAGGTGLKSGSGTRYAVAYVAGTAALVRAARPELNARQVAHRIRLTANPGAQAPPTAEAGWGMLDPRAAVMVSLAEEGARPDPPASNPGPRRAALALVLAIGLASAGLLVRRTRTRAADTGGGRR